MQGLLLWQEQEDGWPPKHIITVGTIVVFISIPDNLPRPLNELANQFNTIQSAIASAERLFEVMDEGLNLQIPDAVELKDPRGEVEFQNVSFSYNSDEPVLKEVSFHAHPTDHGSGRPHRGGKTSIVNLLTGSMSQMRGTYL